MWSHRPTHWLDYYNTHVIVCARNYTSYCIQQTWKQGARCTTLHAPKYALKYALQYTPGCTRLHTPSLLDFTLPIVHDSTLPPCVTYALQFALRTLRSTLRVCSKVHFWARSQIHPWACSHERSQLHSMAHSQPVWLYAQTEALKTLPSKHTSEHALTYTPNCTWWHTPSLLDCTLSNTLSRHSQVHLRVIVKYSSRHTLKYPPNCTRDARHREAWGWWFMAGFFWQAVCSRAGVAGGIWQVAGSVY